MSVQRASELFLKGYNCAQAIAGAYASKVGLTEEQGLKMSACFGAGVAGTREMCGVLSGALMILGLAKGWDKSDSKVEAYRQAKLILAEFEREFSTVKCRDLLTISKARFSDTPSERNAEYYKSRPCLGLVEYAADLLEKYLAE